MTVRQTVVVRYEAECEFCGMTHNGYMSRHAASEALRRHKERCANNPHRCDECNTSLSSCSYKIVTKGRCCCEQCFVTDTHKIGDSDLGAKSIRDAMERKQRRDKEKSS